VFYVFLKNHYKAANITWFIGKLEHDLLKDIKGIDFEVIDKKASFSERKRVKNKYKDINFDVLLHMQRSIRCSFIISGLKSKKIIGFDRPRAKELQWLFTNEKIDKPKSSHAVDVFMEFAYKLGVPRDKAIVWDMGELLQSDDMKKILNFNTDNIEFVGLVVSGSQKDRAWSVKNNAEVINWITKNTKLKIVLLGGPSEFEKNQSLEILNLLTDSSNVQNLTGKTKLKELKSILKKVKLLISPDTGPIHMASALKTPAIGLYVHMPKEITGPYNSLDMCIDKYPVALKKYYNGKLDAKYDGIPQRIKGHNEAINLIEPSEVIDALKEFLGYQE